MRKRIEHDRYGSNCQIGKCNLLSNESVRIVFGDRYGAAVG